MFSIETVLTEMSHPLPYQRGAELWRDPHIAREMLKAHLDPGTDAASYRPETIRAICDFLPERMGLAPGTRIADLGCGPGLYCHRLAARGFHMTGVDWSENSIRSAETLCAGQSAAFRNASYLAPFGEADFDGALLISQDYGVLPLEERQTLLSNVRAALRPGGMFALDVPSMSAYEVLRQTAAPTWEMAREGFWRPHPYIMLSQTHFFPEISASCALYAVLDDQAAIYRNWQTFFSPDSLRDELRAGGFAVTGYLSSLAGDPWTEQSPVLCAVCRRE